ncbi:hypothetical protein DFS34DRAFT_388315 [Phlyctochytrium arcticum]|nr:hypothetical protein DFS34DRAFT_388315 [Phlyctochytrium arcticum]
MEGSFKSDRPRLSSFQVTYRLGRGGGGGILLIVSRQTVNAVRWAEKKNVFEPVTVLTSRPREFKRNSPITKHKTHRMGYCQKCGEIVANTSNICAACGSKAGDASGSGMSSKDNRGDTYSNAYLSSGLNAGVEHGIGRMLGVDPKNVNEVCIECSRKLTHHEEVFVGPTHAGGHIYCQGCYAKNFKKGDCEKCRKPVLGLGKEFVQQEGRVWHKECFDQGKSCVECSKVIFGAAIEAEGKYYHPLCFKCFNCGERLTGSFLEINGNPCCKPCHSKIQQARPSAVSTSRAQPIKQSGGSNPSNSGNASSGLSDVFERKEVADLDRRCDKCLEVVSNGGVQLPDGLLFHDNCFVCQSCGKGINGKYILDESKVYHQECRVSLISANANLQCLKCKKAVSGKFVKLDNGMMHSECFTCAGCNTGLASKPFGDTPSGPKCEQCLTKLPPKFTPGFTVTQSGLKETRGVGGAKLEDSSVLKSLGGTNTCPACNKAVYMQDQVFGPVNTKWHRGCLKCTTCKTALDSMAKMKDVSPYCTQCFSKLK